MLLIDRVIDNSWIDWGNVFKTYEAALQNVVRLANELLNVSLYYYSRFELKFVWDYLLVQMLKIIRFD